MDSFGDLFGGLGDMLGDMFGGDAASEGAAGLFAFLGPDGPERREIAAPIVYERYLCGRPRTLHINDR